MSDMDAPNIKILKFYGKDRYVAFFMTHIKFEQLKNKATVDFPQSKYAYSGIIPGLYVFDEFITEGKLISILSILEEEKQLSDAIDTHEWTKLLNRRVQHYGYEFIYGMNSVDKNKKIGEMPDFCAFLLPSILMRLNFKDLKRS